MFTRPLFRFMILCTFVLILFSCGSPSPPAVSSVSTIKAVIKTTALSVERNIAGITLTLSVPLGVSPPLKGGAVDPAATVEITSASEQSSTLPGAVYTPATSTVPGELTISAILASGFKTSDTITIHLTVAAGAYPESSDFRLLDFVAYDTNGAKVTGLTPSLSATIE